MPPLHFSHKFWGFRTSILRPRTSVEELHRVESLEDEASNRSRSVQPSPVWRTRDLSHLPTRVMTAIVLRGTLYSGQAPPGGGMKRSGLRGRRSYQRCPPPPTPTESSHVNEDEIDGLTMSDLEGLVGIWVKPEEERKSRELAAEQDTAAQSLNNLLDERVAELNVQFCMLGMSLSRARATIKVLLLALVVSQVVCAALLFK